MRSAFSVTTSVAFRVPNLREKRVVPGGNLFVIDCLNAFFMLWVVTYVSELSFNVAITAAVAFASKLSWILEESVLSVVVCISQ